jgi:beta-phosphoglucomutase-like phosphatase (HAD superfamily)
LSLAIQERKYMNYQAIIFDMDGTIVATEQVWEQATQQVIANRGFQVTPEQKAMVKKHFAGLGLPQSCLAIKELTQTADSIEIIMQEKVAIANQLYQQGICFIDGFQDFHKQVTAIPLKTAVATNATQAFVTTTNAVLNLSAYFGAHIYTINHVNNIGKPNPAVYLYAAAQLGIDPKQCIAIEDSAHGIAAAKGAGMFCIGINTSKRIEQVQKAHFIADSYEQIDIASLLLRS